MLALIKNKKLVSQHYENSRIVLHGSLVVMPAVDGWVYDEYSLHTIHPADPVPEGKQITATTVELLNGVWTYVNVLEEIIPPTPEEIRAQMPDLSSRQFWLAAYSIGVTKDDVITMCDGDQTLLIVVNESSVFVRNNPDIILLSEMMNITPEELDSLWLWAAGV